MPSQGVGVADLVLESHFQPVFSFYSYANKHSFLTRHNNVIPRQLITFGDSNQSSGCTHPSKHVAPSRLVLSRHNNVMPRQLSPPVIVSLAADARLTFCSTSLWLFRNDMFSFVLQAVVMVTQSHSVIMLCYK